MNYYECPVCNGFIDRDPCFYCETRAILSTGIGDNIHSTRSEIPTSRDAFEANAPRNRMTSNDTETPEKGATPVKNLEYGMCAKENFNDVRNVSSVPGPSGLREDKNVSNFSTEHVYDSSLSETDLLLLKYKKTFTCCVCKKKIDEHEKNEEGEKTYICCVCNYAPPVMYALHMHSRIHSAKTICEICSKYYTEGDSHKGKRKCIMCEEEFECKSLLYQHYVLHEKHFESICWDCAISIEKHFITANWKKLYFCCICKFETNNRCNLKLHNHGHRRIVCKICNEKYIEQDKKYHDKEYKCTVCEEKFKCISLLEDHYENHKYHLETCYFFCNNNIKDNHKIKANKSFIFCKCSQLSVSPSALREHLYSHTSLHIFKCDACGKKFKLQDGLKKHLKSCVPLPEKCEICRAKFPDTLTLYVHSAEKHGQL